MFIFLALWLLVVSPAAAFKQITPYVPNFPYCSSGTPGFGVMCDSDPWQLVDGDKVLMSGLTRGQCSKALWHLYHDHGRCILQ